MKIDPGAPAHAPGPEDTQFRVRRSFQRRFAAGDLVFDEGDPGEVLFIVLSGEVEITRSGPAGRRPVARFGPGEFFGEMSVVLGGPRAVRAVAHSDCELLEIDGDTLQTMCLERPEIALRMIRRLAARVIELEGRLAALGVDDLLRPVVGVLVRSAQREGEQLRVSTTLRRLAADAGLSLSETHRALHQLIERKLVWLADDVLYVGELDALAHCLDAPA